jgi:hypothetical protein
MVPPMTDPYRHMQSGVISAAVREQAIRPLFMAELYRRSGRTCGTTSGLWEAFRAECLEQFAQGLAERAREHWAQDQEVLVIGNGEDQQ